MAAEQQHTSFTQFAATVSRLCGRPYAFIAAASGVVLWALSGPFFNFDENWQLVINTTTTVITFLMVFVIQSSQNRDTAALHLKLDELIRATEAAKNLLLDTDHMSEDEIQALRKRYASLAHDKRAVPESPVVDEQMEGRAPSRLKAINPASRSSARK